MTQQVHILIAFKYIGHAALIRRNLKRQELVNPVIHFRDGQEELDFLFSKADGPQWQEGYSYLLLLDIRMPKMNSVKVLRNLKKVKSMVREYQGEY